MELRMNYEAFIKLKDFVRIIDINTEIVEFNTKNDTLTGRLIVRGRYMKSDLEKEYHFDEDVPFTVVFNDNNYEIIDVDCVNLEYHVVEGRGLEIMFEVLVEYEEPVETTEELDEVTEVPVEITEEIEEVPDEPLKEVIPTNEMDNLLMEMDLRNLEENNNETSIEEVKADITEEVDNKLSMTLSSVDDNLPTEENSILKLPERKATYKICYYQNDQELETICNKHHLAIGKVFNDNRNNNFDKYRRIMIDHE